MRQPEIRIFRDNGAEIGIKKVMSMYWNNDGQLRTVTIKSQRKPTCFNRGSMSNPEELRLKLKNNN